MKSVIYFHGLESKPGGIKVEFLDNAVDIVEAPAMDYTQKGVFKEWLDYVKTEQPDLIIGSSMGGYFAYELGKMFDIPVLLLNPALHSRSIEPKVTNKFGAWIDEDPFIFFQKPTQRSNSRINTVLVTTYRSNPMTLTVVAALPFTRYNTPMTVMCISRYVFFCRWCKCSCRWITNHCRAVFRCMGFHTPRFSD